MTFYNFDNYFKVERTCFNCIHIKVCALCHNDSVVEAARSNITESDMNDLIRQIALNCEHYLKEKL